MHCRCLGRARGVELELAVGGEQTPVRLGHRLAIVTDTRGLPRLVESLKVEQVHTPVQHGADPSLPEGAGIRGAGSSSPVVGAAVYKCLVSGKLASRNGTVKTH